MLFANYCGNDFLSEAVGFVVRCGLSLYLSAALSLCLTVCVCVCVSPPLSPFE